MRKSDTEAEVRTLAIQVWTDCTGSDVPGHPEDNLPLPSPSCHLHTTFRENQFGFHTWTLEDLEHRLQDALPLCCGSSVSSVRALVPVETCLILQTTLSKPTFGLILDIEFDGL